MSPRGRLLVVSGPSGAGKSTLVRRVLVSRPDVWMSVSATTRAPREGEADGREYFFIDPATFERMRAEGRLIESATFAGNWYGTPRAAVEQRLAAGQTVLLEIELQGARQVRRAVPDCITVFIAPPSREELARRLTDRRTETVAAIDRRLAHAADELAAAEEFDHRIVNDDLDRATDELADLIPPPGGPTG